MQPHPRGQLARNDTLVTPMICSASRMGLPHLYKADQHPQSTSLPDSSTILLACTKLPKMHQLQNRRHNNLLGNPLLRPCVRLAQHAIRSVRPFYVNDPTTGEAAEWLLAKGSSRGAACRHGVLNDPPTPHPGSRGSMRQHTAPCN